MGLLRKVRVLVGALVHKPLAPKPERIELEERSDSTQKEAVGREGSTPSARSAEELDKARVADLITNQRQDGAD